MPNPCRLLLGAALLATLVGVLPSQVSAQAVEPGKEGELAKLVPPQEGGLACFSRYYDEDHLARHPKQTVAQMELRLAYYIHEPDEFFPKGQRNYYFALLAKKRGEEHKRQLASLGECAPSTDGKTIICGVECDGGGFELKRRADGKVLVDLELYGRLRMTTGCDEEVDATELEPGADDKQFLLSSTDQCLPYDEW